MSDVFVQYDAVECARLFELTTWYLLHACTTLYGHSRPSGVTFRYCLYGLKGKLANRLGPSNAEVGGEGHFDERQHLFIICDIDWEIRSMTASASFMALLNVDMITTGCMFRSRGYFD
jgi:hypothetical protein